MKDKKILLLIVCGIIAILLVILLIVSSTIKKQKLSNNTNSIETNTRRIVDEDNSNQSAQIDEIINDPGYVSQGLSEDEVARKMAALPYVDDRGRSLGYAILSFYRNFCEV